MATRALRQRVCLATARRRRRALSQRGDDSDTSESHERECDAGVSRDTLRAAVAGKTLLSADVRLRAVVPAFTADSLAVAARLGMRVGAYANMAPAWCAQPTASAAVHICIESLIHNQHNEQAPFLNTQQTLLALEAWPQAELMSQARAAVGRSGGQP